MVAGPEDSPGVFGLQPGQTWRDAQQKARDYLAKNDFVQAGVWLSRARRAIDKNIDPQDFASLWRDCARLESLRGSHKEAVDRWLDPALERLGGVNHPERYPLAWAATVGLWGQMLLNEGQLAPAVECLERAEDAVVLAQGAQARQAEIQLLLVLIPVYIKLSDTETARQAANYLAELARLYGDERQQAAAENWRHQLKPKKLRRLRSVTDHERPA